MTLEQQGNFPQLDKLVTQFKAAEQKTDTEQATVFEDLARRSNAFTWMGVLSGSDEDGRTFVEVYLSEKVGVNKRTQELAADVTEEFDAFAIKLEPQLALSLHLIPTTELSAEQLREQLQTGAQNSGRSFIYETSFTNRA